MRSCARRGFTRRSSGIRRGTSSSAPGIDLAAMLSERILTVRRIVVCRPGIAVRVVVVWVVRERSVVRYDQPAVIPVRGSPVERSPIEVVSFSVAASTASWSAEVTHGGSVSGHPSSTEAAASWSGADAAHLSADEKERKDHGETHPPSARRKARCVRAHGRCRSDSHAGRGRHGCTVMTPSVPIASFGARTSRDTRRMRKP